MPSEEMLRKLLDEFVEKQTLIDEEMKVVIEQIEQLEARLVSCREQLSTIGADREKVVLMKSRYLDGEFGDTTFGSAIAHFGYDVQGTLTAKSENGNGKSGKPSISAAAAKSSVPANSASGSANVPTPPASVPTPPAPAISTPPTPTPASPPAISTPPAPAVPTPPASAVPTPPAPAVPTPPASAVPTLPVPTPPAPSVSIPPAPAVSTPPAPPLPAPPAPAVSTPPAPPLPAPPTPAVSTPAPPLPSPRTQEPAASSLDAYAGYEGEEESSTPQGYIGQPADQLNEYLSESLFGMAGAPASSPAPPSSAASSFSAFGGQPPAAPTTPPEVKKPSNTFTGINAILGARNTQSNPLPIMRPDVFADEEDEEPEKEKTEESEAETPAVAGDSGGFGILDRFREEQGAITQDAVENSAAEFTWGGESGYEETDVQQQSAAASSSSETQAQSQPQAQAQSESDGPAIIDLGGADDGDETDNDTVKSINDALRSLFR